MIGTVGNEARQEREAFEFIGGFEKVNTKGRWMFSLNITFHVAKVTIKKNRLPE